MGEQIGGSQQIFPQAVVQLQELVERSEALPQEPTRREVKSYAPRAAFPYKASCFSFCLKAGGYTKRYIKTLQEYKKVCVFVKPVKLDFVNHTLRNYVSKLFEVA